MPEVAFVALGSNLGDRAAHLARARAAIAATAGCRVVAASSVEETEPLGGLPQPRYLNQMIAVETELTPLALLRRLQQIEREGGRTRDERWGARTIDLDIVLFDERRVEEPGLVLPHRGLEDREFWQRELAELRGLV